MRWNIHAILTLKKESGGTWGKGQIKNRLWITMNARSTSLDFILWTTEDEQRILWRILTWLILADKWRMDLDRQNEGRQEERTVKMLS